MSYQEKQHYQPVWTADPGDFVYVPETPSTHPTAAANSKTPVGNVMSRADNGTQHKKEKIGGIMIDGKRYTCVSCKEGHRVDSCQHGADRPVQQTKRPGRPSANDPARVVCDCPRTCNCNKKNCKCKADLCLCVDTMYMLVYIPGPGEDQNLTKPNTAQPQGRWDVDYPVKTDLRGNILEDDQVYQRKLAKEAQKRGSGPDSRDNSLVADPNSPSNAVPDNCGGACGHKEAMLGNQNEFTVSIGNVVQPTQGCNCGDMCGCAYCPQHPNNERSQDLTMQQHTFINGQMRNEADTFTYWTPSAVDASCMGAKPRFAVPSQRAFVHSVDQLTAAFPPQHNGSMLLSYPLHRGSSPLPSAMPQSSPGYFSSQQTDTFQGAYQTPVDPVPMSNVNTQQYFALNGWHIGNATLSVDGAHGWIQQNIDSELPEFPPTVIKNNMFSEAQQPSLGAAEPTWKSHEHSMTDVYATLESDIQAPGMNTFFTPPAVVGQNLDLEPQTMVDGFLQCVDPKVLHPDYFPTS